MKAKIFFFAAILFLPSCGKNNEQSDLIKISLVNTSHLDSLYEEINIEGKSMGIIHIYSDYPDYKWIGDDDEGIACVDDAARAAVFYLKDYQLKNTQSSLEKSQKLLEFLLFMQSENGFFYNFIFEDHSSNKTHKNSISEANWWSWRAMWALSEGYKIFKEADKEFADQILSALKKAVDVTKETLPGKKTFKEINGIKFPHWLPYETASDQASVLVLALLNYYEETNDTTVIDFTNNLCDGISLMQKGDSTNIPFYAFLSWQNVWHAYGNSQSYALLKASKILKRDNLKIAALNEINFFYGYLIRVNYLSSFEIEKDNNSFKFTNANKFSQIAYNFRPMIFACLEAYHLTGDTAYEQKAIEISKWYFGKNDAAQQMYDPSNGRCFDGISSENEVNMNSGAESTIEALLSLQMCEQFKISEETLTKNISN